MATPCLRNANSCNVGLEHPTIEECLKVWIKTFASWGDSLTPAVHLKESLYLTSIPLAKDGGMTSWILTDKNLPPNDRPILSSCETFRKRSLASNAEGDVKDSIVHGVASVFCFLEQRGRGYPSRMMKELVTVLRTWQGNGLECVGSILYSDIGKSYYGKLGWHAATTNGHYEFKPKQIPWSPLTKEVRYGDLDALCKKDESMVRKAMAVPADDIKTRVAILGDVDHIGWHIGKEKFATRWLFGKVPKAKGAIAGYPGRQVWAIWTHRYYTSPGVGELENVLYILRLVMEADPTATRVPGDDEKEIDEEIEKEQTEYLKAVLEAAQAQAAEWKLDIVKLWDPTPLVKRLLSKTRTDFKAVEREEDSIASLMWYDDEGGLSNPDASPLLVNNEHYAWL